ncbi:hypothetical protein KQX54_003846 [Cotesia glomerata]|uniref:Neurotransmitter-gated ion-channel transmembrane domain-containing protein n=1 Tax=Cotesia glomerata TaxID=32391 RepID=A0AAV7I751_COTGL|nr:hypothetical protein KQX54_003846 [Cotesia glomerata]
MFMVASSVVLTVLVLNYHHRTADNHEMQLWVKVVLLEWLPWVLRMKRPGRKITWKTITNNRKMREMERKNKSSKSLIANVLDMNDDYRLKPTVSSVSSTYTRTSGHDTPRRPTTVEETTIGMPYNGASCHYSELKTILGELQFITKRMKKADWENEVISDWKFAAMAVDSSKLPRPSSQKTFPKKAPPDSRHGRTNQPSQKNHQVVSHWKQSDTYSTQVYYAKVCRQLANKCEERLVILLIGTQQYC